MIRGDDETLVSANLAGQSLADETALALTFAALVRSVEVGSIGSTSDHESPEPFRSLEKYPEGIYVQAAALLGARRMAQAAWLLRRLDAIT